MEGILPSVFYFFCPTKKCGGRTTTPHNVSIEPKNRKKRINPIK